MEKNESKGSELSTRLRSFFNKVIDRYGENMAYAMGLWNENFRESVNAFSRNAFEEYSDLDLYKELLKNELLCNPKDNDKVNLTRGFVMTDQISSLITYLETDEDYRNTLIAAYVRNAQLSPELLLRNCDNIYIGSYLRRVDEFNQAEYEESFAFEKRQGN